MVRVGRGGSARGGGGGAGMAGVGCGLALPTGSVGNSVHQGNPRSHRFAKQPVFAHELFRFQKFQVWHSGQVCGILHNH